MKKILLMIILLFVFLTVNIAYAEVSNEIVTATIEYVEMSDPYDFSDEPLMDEETAKLEKEREAYEKKNAIEKAVYNKRYIIFGIAIVLVVIITGTVIYVKLNKKRWK